MLRLLKPGGIVVFHEVVFGETQAIFPPCALWDQIYGLVGEVFRRAGTPPDFGRRLGKTFLDAGLPFPAIAAEAVIGGGPGSLLVPWVTATLLNIAPRLKDLGLAPPDGVALDQTLTARLEEAVVSAGCQLQGPTQFGAWARKPV